MSSAKKEQSKLHTSWNRIWHYVSITFLVTLYDWILQVAFLLGNALLAWYEPLSCVCLSITRQYSVKIAKRRITETVPHDSPGTLVF